MRTTPDSVVGVSELLDPPLAVPVPDPVPAGEASSSRARGGPFRAGDRVQLTDPKGRHYTLTLAEKEMSVVERAAASANTVDDIEL